MTKEKGRDKVSKKRLTEDECLKLLEEYKTPEHVVRHCKAVSEAAIKLAIALNKCGYELDIDLIRGAALIHDIARVEEEHWNVGADIADKLGYHDEADIIRVHMMYTMNYNVDDLKEVDLVCFGDRVVKEDRYVGLEERMQYVMEKAKHIPGAVERIKKKTKETAVLFKSIEDKLGMTIDEVMKKER